MFKKKDKRYNTPFDNYMGKYADTFKIGILYLIIGLIGYGAYSLYNFISS